MWNSANDSAGSGLDADLLDNLHSSSFYRKDYTSTDFNSATSEGKYRINSSNNAPYTGCTDWVCLVYHLSGGTSELYQIAMEECQNVPTSITGGSTTTYSVGFPMVFVRKRYNSTWYSWQMLWHSGNDGSGSGLNADKLDDKHASDFVSCIKSTSSTNIDSITTEGMYEYTNVTSTEGLPSFTGDGTTYGLIVKSVKGSSTYNCCFQILLKDGCSYVYMRYYHSSTWSSWEKLNPTASELLTKIKTVDGSGSGLDADLLDGKHATSFAQTSTSFYTDFNSIPLVVGMYGVSNTASNSPVSSTGVYTAIVTKTSTGYMMLAINTVDSNIYRRHTTGAWSASTPWVTIGGTGLQQATVTCVDSSNAESTTSYYLRVSRADTSTALKSGDVLSVTMTNASTYSGSLCYVRYVDSTTSVSKYLYNANGSSQVPISQLPKYFLMRYDGTNFEILTPLNQTVTISTSDPTSETSGKYGDVWYTY